MTATTDRRDPAATKAAIAARLEQHQQQPADQPDALDAGDELLPSRPLTAAERAERAVLGVVIAHPEHAAEVFARVSVADFTGPRAAVAEAIHGLRLARKGIDPVLLLGELQRRGSVARAGGPAEVAKLVGADTWSNVALLGGYLDEIVTEVRRRRAWQIGARLTQLAGDPTADPVSAARATADQLTALVDAADFDAADVTTMTLREFLDVEDDPYDWVIPGLLERGDRLIITGSEGLGKSTLFRQIGVCAAAGIHPFTGRHFEPQRTLIVDLENGPTKLRRELRPLRARARQVNPDADTNLWIETRPEGLDLQNPHDEAWLVRLVATLQPQILLTGSLYRMHRAKPEDEQAARAVTVALDRCRAAANCAVVLEAHSGHAQGGSHVRPVRPIGSSLWLRWPEYGYGIAMTEDYNPQTRIVDWVAWRGDREERDWPQRLKAGGAWPWSLATYDEHNAADPAAGHHWWDKT